MTTKNQSEKNTKKKISYLVFNKRIYLGTQGNFKNPENILKIIERGDLITLPISNRGYRETNYSVTEIYPLKDFPKRDKNKKIIRINSIIQRTKEIRIKGKWYNRKSLNSQEGTIIQVKKGSGIVTMIMILYDNEICSKPIRLETFMKKNKVI